MNRNRNISRPLALAAALALTLPATMASATNYSVDWLKLAPTPFGTTPPANGNYAAPAPYGPVTLNVSTKTGFVDGRQANALVLTGSVTHNADTYWWTSQEVLGSTYLSSNPPATGVNQAWTVSYTFNTPVPTGQQAVLGIFGLGKRSPSANETFADARSLATVLAPAGSFTYLGEYKPATWGASAFNVINSGNGFTLENSLTAPGGADPHWNSGLALVSFDPTQLAGNTLTVRFDQTLGDGLGVNVGFLPAVPEPGSWLMFSAGLAGLSLLRRRRTFGAGPPSSDVVS